VLGRLAGVRPGLPGGDILKSANAPRLWLVVVRKRSTAKNKGRPLSLNPLAFNAFRDAAKAGRLDG